VPEKKAAPEGAASLSREDGKLSDRQAPASFAFADAIFLRASTRPRCARSHGIATLVSAAALRTEVIQRFRAMSRSPEVPAFREWRCRSVNAVHDRDLRQAKGDDRGILQASATIPRGNAAWRRRSFGNDSSSLQGRRPTCGDRGAKISSPIARRLSPNHSRMIDISRP
jgi:hypothetical protein